MADIQPQALNPTDKPVPPVSVKTPSDTGAISIEFYSGDPTRSEDDKITVSIQNLDDTGAVLDVQNEDESVLTIGEVNQLQNIAARLRGKSQGRYGK